MGYELFTDHPESESRRAENFTSWSFWAPDNAPWTGVSLSEMATVLERVCAAPGLDAACATLDTGGTLPAPAARLVLRLAETRMSPETAKVFRAAVKGGYGVRVVFSKGAFGALSASAYLAKHGSA
jgi:hypothetical protein